MKISELKTGMKVKMKSGDIGVVLLDTEFGDIVSGGTCFSLGYDSIEKFNQHYDWAPIVAVYKQSKQNNVGVLKDDGKHLDDYTKIWPKSHTVSIDGEEREISDESFEAIKDIFKD